MQTFSYIRKLCHVLVLALAATIPFDAAAQEGTIQTWLGTGSAYDALVNPLVSYEIRVQVIYVNEIKTLNITELTFPNGEQSTINCEITREASGLQTSNCDNGNGFGVQLGPLIQLTRIWNLDGSIEQIVLFEAEDGLSKQIIRTVYLDGEVRSFHREDIFRVFPE